MKYTGLNAEQVAEARARGEINTAAAKTTKTIGAIIRDNLLTLFNLINIALFVLLILADSIKNTLYMLLVVGNTLIGIVQEIRAKRVIDRLNVLTAMTAVVIRDGQEQTIPVDQLVTGDVFIISPGSQICVDGSMLSSENLELDESMLTGESDAVRKQPGDQVLSGSFAVAGRGIAVAERVGSAAYAQQLTNEARRQKKAHSEIYSTLSRIIRYITYFIVPAGVLLFLSQFLRSDISWQSAMSSTAGALLGMIPNGLWLLTSIAFAAGVIKLAAKRTVVREMAGMEVLARVDLLCLDKTGTLTQGRLCVEECVPYADDWEKCAAALANAFEDKNFTASALCERFPSQGDVPTETIPFSSKRKYSAACFENCGWLVQGAPEFLLPEDHAVRKEAQHYAERGYRVLLLASSSSSPDTGAELSPLALIILSDKLRENAAETLEYFRKQGVSVRVISGDNPLTVMNVAERLGLHGKYTDASQLTDQELAAAAEDTIVFGRVSPAQKKLLVDIFKKNGHTVAMTGDGTNDVPALRAADCSIAMAAGTDAAKGVSHVVLLDSDFSCMPGVVAEGRRVIGNIERVSSLFLVKTTFSIVLTLFFILTGLTYPFQPIHMTIVSATAVGIPSFFLALEPNRARVTPGFFRKVIKNALPSGLCVALCIIVIELLLAGGVLSSADARFISLIVTEVVSLTTLIIVSRPINVLRGVLIAVMAGAFAATILIAPRLFELTLPQSEALFAPAGACILCLALLFALRFALSRFKAFKNLTEYKK